MKYTDFNVKTHGFAGHMAEPEGRTGKAESEADIPLKVMSAYEGKVI